MCQSPLLRNYRPTFHFILWPFHKLHSSTAEFGHPVALCISIYMYILVACLHLSVYLDMQLKHLKHAHAVTSEAALWSLLAACALVPAAIAAAIRITALSSALVRRESRAGSPRL